MNQQSDKPFYIAKRINPLSLLHEPKWFVTNVPELPKYKHLFLQAGPYDNVTEAKAEADRRNANENAI